MTTKRNPTTTPLGSFPCGEAVASVKLKAVREPTREDLEHGILACEQLTRKLHGQLSAMEE